MPAFLGEARLADPGEQNLASPFVVPQSQKERSSQSFCEGIMNIRDLLSSLLWLAISIFVCVESSHISIGSLHSPASGFLPFWSGVILGTFAIVLAVKSILIKGWRGKISDLWKEVEWNKVIFVLISLFLYAFLLPRLGYLITTFGLMTFLFGMKGKPRLWAQAVTAFITVGVSYIIFYLWLDVQLPKGVFGF